MCPQALESEVHLRFDDYRTYDDLKTYLLNLVHLRTSGPAPMLNSMEWPGADEGLEMDGAGRRDLQARTEGR
eukprot:3589215-Lingulodinium_polyedra.AAC.1